MWILSTEAKQGIHLDVEAHSGPVRDLAFTVLQGNGQLSVVTGGEDGFVKVWNARRGDPVHSFHHQSPVNCVCPVRGKACVFGRRHDDAIPPSRAPARIPPRVRRAAAWRGREVESLSLCFDPLLVPVRAQGYKSRINYVFANYRDGNIKACCAALVLPLSLALRLLLLFSPSDCCEGRL